MANRTPLSSQPYRETRCLQDGNEGFNAFSLGFIDLVLLDEGRQFSQLKITPAITRFLEIAQERLSLDSPSWGALVKCIKESSTQIELLQKHFSMIFRLFLLEHSKAGAMEETIKEVFTEHVMNLIEQEDISDFPVIAYRQIPALLDQFNLMGYLIAPMSKEDRCESSINKAILDSYSVLLKWWHATGHTEYLLYLNQNKSWIGSYELSFLGDIFDIDIIITVNQMVSTSSQNLQRHIALRNNHQNEWVYLQDPHLGRLPLDSRPDSPRPLSVAISEAFKNLPRSVPKTHRHVDAVGDGNCCFNAFSLGFCDLVLSGALDAHSTSANYLSFVGRASQWLKITEVTWEGVKSFVDINKNNPILLQKSLAPLFRALAAEAHEAENLVPSLLAEFREFAYRIMGVRVNERFRGDIFKRIPAIQDQFNHYREGFSQFQDQELGIEFANEIINPCCDEISAWWQEQGLAIFKVAMHQNGEWAGDAELAFLGRFFNLNIKLRHGANNSGITECYGQFSRPIELNAEDLQQLVQRGIIKPVDPQDDLLAFRELNAADLAARLCEIDHHEVILERFVETGIEGPIESEWVPGLVQRELIVKTGASYRWIQDLNFESIFTRICAFVLPEKIQELFVQHYRPAPALLFANPLAAHWYYEQEIASAQLDLVDQPERQDCQTDRYSRLRSWNNRRSVCEFEPLTPSELFDSEFQVNPY